MIGAIILIVILLVIVSGVEVFGRKPDNSVTKEEEEKYGVDPNDEGSS